MDNDRHNENDNTKDAGKRICHGSSVPYQLHISTFHVIF